MHSVKRFFLFAVVAASVFGTASVYAQKIGVVDGNDILNNYDDAKKADEKIKNLNKIWTDSVQMMTKAAQEKQQSYMKILSTMSEDAKQKAQAELDQLGQGIQAYQNSKFNSTDGELIKTRNELLKPILEKIKNTVTDVAKKKKVDLVLDKNSVIFTGTAVVDLTEDVKKALK